MKLIHSLFAWLGKKLRLPVSRREEQRKQALTEAEYWARCLEEVHDGRRADPLWMTPTERHLATRQMAAQMEWSGQFEYQMRTPLVLQLKETGKAVDLLGGDDFTGPHAYLTEKELITRNVTLLLRKTNTDEENKP